MSNFQNIVYTPEEIRERRVEWVKQLRTGKYDQITGRLRKTQGFCCVGVACDISNMGEWIISTFSNNAYNFVYEDITSGGPDGYKFFKYYYDFSEVDCQKFYSMNDQDRKTFVEIADYVEETYLNVD